MDVLRELRRQRGQSLREAASDLGIDSSQLSRLERGERALSRDVAERLSAYYDVPNEQIEIAAGLVPPDLLEILRRHPEAATRLRELYPDA